MPMFFPQLPFCPGFWWVNGPQFIQYGPPPPFWPDPAFYPFLFY